MSCGGRTSARRNTSQGGTFRDAGIDEDPCLGATAGGGLHGADPVEALQRRQAFRADTSVEDYLRRCIAALGGDSATMSTDDRPQRRQNAGVSNTRNV